MISQLALTTTLDGSKTLFNEAIGESYHSMNGAIQESKHVFIEAGLDYYCSSNHVEAVSVLEVGMGTGLNFLLSAEWGIKHNIQLDFLSIEKYPLSLELIQQIDYQKYVSLPLWGKYVEKYSRFFQESKVDFLEKINLQVCVLDVRDFYSEVFFDLIFYDAFSLKQQPEMWTLDTLEIVCRYLKKGGVFVTYAITGELKRNLKTLGFRIEKLQGPIGKREMLRATKL